MTDNLKIIHDWQEKVRSQFGDESKLYHYLFETMENFFYRYLETSENKNLKIKELAPNVFGAESFESSMVEALKVKNEASRAGIMELAKSIPKAQKPMVRYRLETQIHELKQDKGHLTIIASIHWGFPEFSDQSKMSKKQIEFKYGELAQFRKELALNLEAACDLFQI